MTSVYSDIIASMEKITLKQITPFKDLKKMLQHTTFRGVYGKNEENLHPYKYAKFSIVKVHPQKNIGHQPEITVGGKREPLFTPQPTIYENQTKIMEEVDNFLLRHGITMSSLRSAIEYDWEGRGTFHVLPPIIEKHVYHMQNGYIDLKKLSNRFKGAYVKDARGNLHHLADRYLKSFYIDEVSNIHQIDTFGSNIPIINYGLGQNGKFTFYTICDGAHRIDYVLEKIGQPITAILVETTNERRPLYPYYALPVPFRPVIRLSSKKSEKMYHKLDRDKIHLLNDFICKSLHYNWEKGGLKVSKLRSNVEIH